MKRKEITLENIADMMGYMSKKIDVLVIDVRELKADVAELKHDVAILKTDVAELKHDVAILKTDVAKLKEDVALIKIDISQLRKDVDGHYHEFLDTRDDVQKILEIAKGNDGTLGMWQIATAR